MWKFPLWPESASTFSFQVDSLMAFMLALTLFFSVGIAAVLVYFAWRYRHDSDANRVTSDKWHLWVEITWTVIPLALMMVIFFWSSGIFYHIKTAPSNAVDVYVTGKQWMWKTQHPQGVREINSLHVPAGVPIKLNMISEDVIHSFYIPAFRVKQDVLPGRYTTMWFEANKPGTYHLFCAEYCGTTHSGMVGKVVVMEPGDYQTWLAGGTTGESMQSAGEKQFNKFGCITCHQPTGAGRGPTLVGVYDKKVKLSSGKTVAADATYLRESILNPGAKLVAGYENIMPQYQTQLSEQNVMELIAYIKSLKGN